MILFRGYLAMLEGVSLCNWKIKLIGVRIIKVIHDIILDPLTWSTLHFIPWAKCLTFSRPSTGTLFLLTVKGMNGTV